MFAGESGSSQEDLRSWLEATREPAPETAPPPPAAGPEKPKRKSSPRLVLVLFAVVFLVVLCAGLYLAWTFFAPVAEADLDATIAAQHTALVSTVEATAGAPLAAATPTPAAGSASGAAGEGESGTGGADTAAGGAAEGNPAVTGPLAGEAARFVSTGCPFDKPEGAAVECGYVLVPEDHWGNPNDQIRLPVAVFYSAAADKDPAPLVFLQGGPGGSALDLIGPDLYELFIRPVTARRDLVLFDQRGTGAAVPSLNCPDLLVIYQQTLLDRLPPEERAGRIRKAFQGCQDRLRLSGVDVAAYTTTQNAADVIAVTRAFGYPGPINLYGASYGTRLALAVMRDYPGYVRAAVLDSVLPLEARLYNDLPGFGETSLQRLFDNCAADAECRRRYPDLEGVFWDLVERLRAQPVEVPTANLLTWQIGSALVDDKMLVNTIIWGLYDSSVIPYLPQAIFDMRSGDYAFMTSLLSVPLTSTDGISIGMHFAVNCHEQVFASSPDELGAALAAFPRVESYGRNVTFDDPALFYEACELLGAAPFDPADNLPLLTDLPALVLAGQYDSRTPPEYAEQVAKNLFGSYYFVIPGKGHVPSIDASSTCARDLMLAFLDNPEVEPDAACLAGMDSAPFE